VRVRAVIDRRIDGTKAYLEAGDKGSVMSSWRDDEMDYEEDEFNEDLLCEDIFMEVIWDRHSKKPELITSANDEVEIIEDEEP